ncbi:MAG: pilin [Pseudomonadota bacterium]
MTPHRAARGFTLIELMIVVAIIAILAAIAVPAYQNYVIRAQVSEGVSLSASAKAAVWDYLSNTGRYPSNNISAGLATNTSIKGLYVSKVDVQGGKVTVAFNGPGANDKIRSQTLVLSPISHTGSIDWTCKPSTIDGKYLPTLCRK